MKVMIIIPYFGESPQWFEYFLQTCEANPAYSWLIYSNCEKPEIIPRNVKFIHSNLLVFNHLASQKLNLKINIINPYKICDLKPSFGKIFEDYIKNYDFWGHSDLDLVYGDLSHFITAGLLKTYDIISVRKDYFTGHFTLYRNTETVNTLYKKGHRFEEIFQDNNYYYAFDERLNSYGKKLFQNKNRRLIKQVYSSLETLTNKIKFKLKTKYWNPQMDMTNITKTASQDGIIQHYAQDMVRSDLWFQKQGISQWEVAWINGELHDIINKKELLHFHLIKSKKNKQFTISKWKPNASFTISESKMSVLNQ